jgi:hypothetical protein
MKTQKAKTVSKPKKTSTSSKTVRSKKVTTGKSVPNEDEIRKKAEEIYHKRIASGKDGTAIDDWYTAEELLKGSGK